MYILDFYFSVLDCPKQNIEIIINGEKTSQMKAGVFSILSSE